MAITALAPWFGSNRMLGKFVGEELTGMSWVGIGFAGGMGEVMHIGARTILVNDKHRHVVNLARVIAGDELRRELLRRLDRKLVHPDTLSEAQERCSRLEPIATWVASPDVGLAEAYFICCWMGRSGKAGTKDEFNGGLAIRWNAGGGDSAVRFYHAIRDMVTFGRAFHRCTFDTSDAFDFHDRCEDADGSAIYDDPPFPVAGRKYAHNCGKTEASEREWHTRLRDAVSRFKKTRVVLRFYDHPLIRELYPEDRWTWRFLTGRDQANGEKPEVLLINGPSKAKADVLF